MTEHGLNCMLNYATQCLKGQSATFATTLLGNLKEHYAKRCKDEAFGAIFREHSKCFDGEGVLEQFHQCEDRWYHRMQALQSLGNGNRVQNQRATCCAYFHYQQCVRDLNVAVCHDKNARFWDEIIGDVVSAENFFTVFHWYENNLVYTFFQSTGATSMICPDLKSVEQCASSFPADVWAAIDGPVAAMDAAALRARNGKFKSKIITIFDMMNDFKLSPNAAV